MAANAGSVGAAVHQQRVTDHFSSHAGYWKDLYGPDATLFGVIHRTRRDVALRWIDSLGLPAGSRVLDVGCGAGIFAVELARRGFAVTAVDHSPSMVALARDQAVAAGFVDRVATGVADAHGLPFATGSFDLVVALGVLPFMHTPAVAMAELARVATADAAVVFSSDNRYRLNHLLDPRYTPLVTPLKRGARALAARMGYRGRGVPGHKASLTQLRSTMLAAGLDPRRVTALGYGPFSFLGRTVLPDPAGIRVHVLLQAWSDRGLFGLPAVGAQHLVMAGRAVGTGVSG